MPPKTRKAAARLRKLEEQRQKTQQEPRQQPQQHEQEETEQELQQRQSLIEERLTSTIEEFKDELNVIKDFKMPIALGNQIRDDKDYDKYTYLKELIPSTSGGNKKGGKKRGNSVIKTIPKKVRKKIRKIYKGPRGGTYYKSKGRKIYLK